MTTTRLNITWAQSKKIEICGKVKLRWNDRLYVFTVHQWTPLQHVWGRACMLAKINPHSSFVCGVEAEGFEDERAPRS